MCLYIHICTEFSEVLLNLSLNELNYKLYWYRLVS